MKHARMAFLRSRRAAVLLTLGLLGTALPARAWNRDQHLAIVRAAMGISAAADDHLPLEFRDALFKDVAEPDYMDKECRYHASDTGPKEAAAVAEQLLAQILTPKTPLKPYVRAQLVGRYLHYVADVVTPAEMRRENASKLVNFFANRDFIFFRERREPLAAPLAASLRKRGEEALWANVNQESGYTAVFRCAVNTVADAILLLPAREGAAARDEGPVYFLVNRVDTGLAGKASEGHYEKSTQTGWRTYTGGGYTWEVAGTWTTYNWVEGQKGGGDSFKKRDMMERGGAQLVELRARQEKDRLVLRGIFFNNNDACAEGVGLKAGAWNWQLPGGMSPNSIRAFETTAPADLLSRHLSNGYRTTQCQGVKTEGSIAAARRVVVGNGGDTPRFEYGTQAVDISTQSKGTTTNLTPRN